MVDICSIWGLKSIIPSCRENLPEGPIAPPKSGAVYFGAAVNGYVDEEHTVCFEATAAQEISIAVRPLTMGDIKMKRSFPTEEADYLFEKGGTLLINITLKPEELSQLLKGELDKHLEAFAEGSEDFEKPVFITVSIKNGTAEQTSQAYRYVQTYLKMKGVKNLTWANHSGRDAHWVMREALQTKDANGYYLTFASLFNPAALPKGKPIMLIVGSDAPEEIRRQFLLDAASAARQGQIQALILLNAPEIKDGAPRDWAIKGAEEKRVLRTALSGLAIKTIFPARPKTKPILPYCPSVERHYYDAAVGYEIRTKKELIAEASEEVTNQLFANEKRIFLARMYTSLAYLTRDKTYLHRAFQTLAYGISVPEENRSYKKDKNGAPVAYFRNFADVLIEMIIAYQSLEEDPLEALKFAQQVEKQLVEPTTRQAQQIKGYSDAGYRARISLIRAQILRGLKQDEEAQKLFEEIIAWAEPEAKTYWPIPIMPSPVHVFRDEVAEKIQYLAMLAHLELGFIKLDRAGNYGEAKAHFLKVLNWEETGSEYLDLSLKAMVGLMVICSATADNYPREFDQLLPWEKIDGYDDFKKMLDLEDLDLEKIPHKWDLFLDKMMLNLRELAVSPETKQRIIQLDLLRKGERK